MTCSDHLPDPPRRPTRLSCLILRLAEDVCSMSCSSYSNWRCDSSTNLSCILFNRAWISFIFNLCFSAELFALAAALFKSFAWWWLHCAPRVVGPSSCVGLKYQHGVLHFHCMISAATLAAALSLREGLYHVVLSLNLTHVSSMTLDSFHELPPSPVAVRSTFCSFFLARADVHSSKVRADCVISISLILLLHQQLFTLCWPMLSLLLNLSITIYPLLSFPPLTSLSHSTLP